MQDMGVKRMRQSVLVSDDSRTPWRVNTVLGNGRSEVEHTNISSAFLLRIPFHLLDGGVLRLHQARWLKIVVYFSLGMLIIHPDPCSWAR